MRWSHNGDDEPYDNNRTVDKAREVSNFPPPFYVGHEYLFMFLYSLLQVSSRRSTSFCSCV